MTRTTALFALVSTTASLVAQPIPHFHWPLNESSGNIAHDVYGSSHGQLLGGASWAPSAGHHGGACRFDGVDDRILLGPCDITSGTGQFSVSAWVRPDFVTAMDRTLLAKTVGPSAQDHIWSMSFVGGSALRFRLRTGPVTTELSTSPSSIFSGTWYHVVGSFDGSMMRIYLNGSVLAATPATGSMGYHPQAPASIAALSTGAAPFSGWVDDVRLYDRGLTQQEVVTILLESDVSTGLRDERPRSTSDGRLVLPTGRWTSGQLVDASGRAVRTINTMDLVNGLHLEGTAPGLYLICLQEQDRRASWPIAVQ